MHLLEQRIEELRKEKNIAGMSVAITDKKKILYAKGFGVESIERPEVPTRPDALYPVASITKMVTGLLIMRLVEQGMLDLDIPVIEYIPWLSLNPPKATEQLTLRHLLNHTGGFPSGVSHKNVCDELALERVLQEELSNIKLISLPEEGMYQYSNLGIRIVGLVAETITKKRYSELAKELVLEPLGMDHSTFDLREACTYPLSLPHVPSEGGALKVRHHIRRDATYQASGGLYSNPIDLCKLARLLLNEGRNDSGEQLLQAESMQEMFRKHVTKKDFPGDYYGLTMTLHKYGSGYLIGHPGSFHPYATSVFADPISGIGVVTLMNTSVSELRFEIPEMVLAMMTKTN